MYLKRIATMLCLAGTLLMAESNTTTPQENTHEEALLATKPVEVEGVKALDMDAVYDAISAEHASFLQFWKDKTPTIKVKLLPTIRPALRAFYDSEGYYDAKFKIEDKGTVVKIKITEGEPVRIHDINVTSDFDITDEIKALKKGEVFKTSTFTRAKANIINALMKEGYCSYELDSKAFVDLDTHTVDIRFIVNKGGVCTFGNMTVNGTTTVSDDVIRSRVRAVPGERFSTERVRETYEALGALSAFDKIQVGVDRKFYNVVPVDIVVREMEEPYHVEFGAGYDTYVGARVHGTFVKNNFFGNAQQLRLRAAWSQREQLATGAFFKPVLFYPFDYAIDFGLKLGYSNLEYEGFREEKTFIRAYLEHTDEVWLIRLGMALENPSISSDSISEGKTLYVDPDTGKTVPITEADYVLTYPYLRIVYDKRDDKLNPKEGYYIAYDAELGLATETDSSSYVKQELELRGIYTAADLTMALVGKVGVIDDIDKSPKGIPESKKFLVGGAYYNRAYGYREMGVIMSPTSFAVNGAQTMANLSLELDYPVWGDLSAAVFSDNTMLAYDPYDFSGEVISAAGAGVRYLTPIGPFKFDAGFNVHDPSQWAVTFQIGQSF